MHQRDNGRLLSALKGLRDLGNTLIVVEHDEETMMESDYLVDIGPGAGVHGGEVVAAGTPQEVMHNERSITGAYLSGRKIIPIPKQRVKPGINWIKIKGAEENNLKGINVDIPIGAYNLRYRRVRLG